uniref:Uncharacterized protein n=1 Tax=Panagrolaimus sp. ES5 TaxID=591445 RepID=A0AC34G5S2_9BILA
MVQLTFMLLLIFLVSRSVCLEDHKRVAKKIKLASTKNEKIKESKEVVEIVTKEMQNIIDVLPEIDLTETSRSILKSSGIIGSLLGLGFDNYFPEEDPIMEKLNKITERLVEKFDEISEQIQKATEEIKAFIEYKTFQEDMKTLLNSNAISNQLQFFDYSEEAFEKIEELYKNMTKQLMIAYPICETLVSGEKMDEKKLEKRQDHIIKYVAEIEAELKEENEKRIEILNENRRKLQLFNNALEDLESRVEAYKSRQDVGWEDRTIYGKARCGEHFAILTTNVLWSAVTLFTQNIRSICSARYANADYTVWLKRKEYWTVSGAREVAEEWKELLETGKYGKVLQY